MEGIPCACDAGRRPTPWTPDGQKVILQINTRSPYGKSLLVIDPITGRTLPINEIIGEEAQSGVVSPDGRLFFLVGRDRFHILDLKAGTKSSAPARRLIRLPVWMPDSKGVLIIDRAYDRAGRFVGYDTSLMTAESGQMIQLPTSRKPPLPSPDGRYLAFTAIDGSFYTISVLEMETGRVWPLALPVEIKDDPGEWLAPHPVAWSPDNGMVVYTSGEVERVELYLVATKLPAISE